MRLKNPFRKKKRDPEAQAAYDKAFREAQLERATKAGKEAGSKKPKSFLDKMASMGDNVLKSGMFAEPTPQKRKGKGKAQDLEVFLLGTPQKKRRKRRKR